MSIMKAVANHFKEATNAKSSDRFGLLHPLIITSDYLKTCLDMVKVIQSDHYKNLVSRKEQSTNKFVNEALFVYEDYVKSLSSSDQQKEHEKPFSVITEALISINGNIEQIEDRFQELFGNVETNNPEEHLKTSSLFVIGYLEKCENFATWISNFVDHLTIDEGDTIAPFKTKELKNNVSMAASFTSLNLHKWSSKTKGFLNDVSQMQKKGLDMYIQNQEGDWVDEFIHDNQYSRDEQDFIASSLRSPIIMAITWGQNRTKAKLDLLTSRKDWLTSKILLEQAKLRSMDETSPEYKRIKKAVDYYANLVSRYEQKIERLRA